MENWWLQSHKLGAKRWREEDIGGLTTIFQMVVLDLRDWRDGNNWVASLQLALSGKACHTSILSIPSFLGARSRSFL